MKYYCVRQLDETDCGAACIATISKYYGLSVSVSKIREIAGTDKQGTNVYGIIKACEQLGFSTRAIKTYEKNKDAIFTNFTLPAIAHIVSEEKTMHYIVVYEISKSRIVVADPDKGIKKYAPEEFLKLWTGVLILMLPIKELQTDNKKNNILINFMHLISSQKKIILFTFILSLFITAFGVASSYYFTIIMDMVIVDSSIYTLTIFSICVIILYILKSLFEFFRNQLMMYLGKNLDISLMLGYYNHVIDMPMSFFDTRKNGEIISRFMDASKIREAISGATLTIMIDSIMAIVGGIILYRKDSKLFLITVVLIIVYGIIVLLYKYPIKYNNEKQMEENSRVMSYLMESLNGIETIKSFNAEENVKKKTYNLFKKFLQSSIKVGNIYNGQNALTTAIYLIGETFILWIGTLDILNGNLTIGELMTFNALLMYFIDPIKNLINVQTTMQSAVVAATRLGEILELSTEKEQNENNKIKNISLDKKITISNVNFRYGTRQLILKDINMIIRPKEKIALIGESGSGKTTFVKLLMKFYSFESGTIMIGDYDIRNLDINFLRQKIAYISQDIYLFSGTIKDNLILGKDNVKMEDIIEACYHSKADEFINKLPLKYETKLEENGSNLSGGQRQRLAIARALIKKPDILIMDEATSNLDSITEKTIEKTIDRLCYNTTTIIIAHRLSTIKNCDRIYVFENGKIVEQGNHKQLMDKKQRYYNFWKEQLP